MVPFCEPTPRCIRRSFMIAETQRRKHAFLRHRKASSKPFCCCCFLLTEKFQPSKISFQHSVWNTTQYSIKMPDFCVVINNSFLEREFHSEHIVAVWTSRAKSCEKFQVASKLKKSELLWSMHRIRTGNCLCSLFNNGWFALASSYPISSGSPPQ